MRRAIIAFLISGALDTSQIAHAQKSDSAAYYYPGCIAFLRAYDDNVAPDPGTEVKSGACFGMVGGVFGMYQFYADQWTFCPPNDLTTVSAMRTVVNWLSRHPEHMPRQFGATVLAAMREAWPCPVGKKP
jgi:hypothetical protein